jgi:hypothetical protein
MSSDFDTGTVWADDRSFSLESVTWPEGESLRVLTKQHWDKNLNVEYTCPTLADGYKSQLFGEDTSKQTCTNKAQPMGQQQWVPWETGSFFLFQDQCLVFSPLQPTCRIKGPEAYHEKGSVATLKETGETKEFTVMAGNMNEKVQMLQVCCPDILGSLFACAHTYFFAHTYFLCHTLAREVRVLYCVWTTHLVFRCAVD